MLQFKVKVLFVQEEERDLPIKDKFGIPTTQTKHYKFLTVQGLAKDVDLKVDRPVVVKSVDPTFPSPKSGDEWTTPEVRKYEIDNGQPIISV